MTPLSRVITSFHPIERHSIHRLRADPDSAGQAGQRGPPRVRGGEVCGGGRRWRVRLGGWGGRGREGGREEATGRPGRKGGEGGGGGGRAGGVGGWIGVGRGGRGWGGDSSPKAHHSQVCVQTLVKSRRKKRVALQRPSPPASLPPLLLPLPPQVCLCSWATYGLEGINILPCSAAEKKKQN